MTRIFRYLGSLQRSDTAFTCTFTFGCVFNKNFKLNKCFLLRPFPSPAHLYSNLSTDNEVIPPKLGAQQGSHINANLNTNEDEYENNNNGIVLRPYQEQCIQECLQSIESGINRIGISCPTGSGKTTIFTSLIEKLPNLANNASKTLVLVHNIELARQASSTIQKAFPYMTVEIEQGTHNVASGNSDVTVATYQTLYRSTRLKKFDPSQYKAIIIDEAHHSAAPSYLKILAHFDPSIADKQLGVKLIDEDVNDVLSSTERSPLSIPILGFSATFSRSDGLALGKIYDRIVFHKDFIEMIQEKWLCPVRFTTVNASYDLDEVKTNSYTGDYSSSSLSKVINTTDVNKIVIRTWLDQAKGRKSTLVFAVNIDHVQSLTNAFREISIDAKFIHSGTKRNERYQIMDAFRRQEFPVLVNCGILTEGADVPNIDCVLLARPTKSKGLFSQMIGRGLRLSPNTGKNDCLILDMVGNHCMGVINAPSLFGLDPSILVKEKSASDLMEMQKARQDKLQKEWEKEKKIFEDIVSREVERKHEAEKEHGKITSLDINEYDSIFELVDQIKKNDSSALGSGKLESLIVLKSSPYAWVRYKPGKFALTLLSGFHIYLKRNDETGEYAAELYDKKSSNTTILFKNEPSLQEAIKKCDAHANTYMKQNFGGTKQLLRWAPWRSGKSSNSQLDLLKKSGVAKKYDPDSFGSGYDEYYIDFHGKKICLNEITKGQAADILTKREANKRRPNMPIWVKRIKKMSQMNR